MVFSNHDVKKMTLHNELECTGKKFGILGLRSAHEDESIHLKTFFKYYLKKLILQYCKRGKKSTLIITDDF